jgi:hypothetical protein
MFRVILVVFATWLMSFAAQAEEQPTAGFFTAVELVGADLKNPAILQRANDRMVPKLLMPVQVGDLLALKDGKSLVTLEMADGKSINVAAGAAAFVVAKSGTMGSDGWSVIAAIGDLFGDKDNQTPDNMVSRGGTLEIPMVNSSVNYLEGQRMSLWLKWLGGKGPFEITIEYPGAPQVVGGIAGQEATIALAKPIEGAVFVALRDQAGGLKRFKLRAVKADPGPANGNGEGLIAQSARLLTKDQGKWRLHVSQLLHEAGPANAAGAAISEGLVLGKL